MCSFCLYFADIFSSTMWSDLRAAVPKGSSALLSPASSLRDVALASRAPSTSSKYFSDPGNEVDRVVRLRISKPI